MIPNKLNFSASKSLTQFNVINCTFYSMENNSKVIVELVLQRILFYHLTNTFIPTTSLLVISEITLLFDDQKTEVAIGLSLTVLLVMYTMYQSISAALTKTAYLKMIDFWLLFCLLLPFAIFMIEVYWLLRNIAKIDIVNKNGIRKRNRFAANRRKIQLFVFLITIIFIVSFAAIAVIVTNKF